MQHLLWQFADAFRGAVLRRTCWQNSTTPQLLHGRPSPGAASALTRLQRPAPRRHGTPYHVRRTSLWAPPRARLGCRVHTWRRALHLWGQVDRRRA